MCLPMKPKPPIKATFKRAHSTTLMNDTPDLDFMLLETYRKNPRGKEEDFAEIYGWFFRKHEALGRPVPSNH